MPRHRIVSRIALICAAALALAVAGCSGGVPLLDDKNEGGWFSKPIEVFAKPEWAKFTDAKTAELGPQGPVAPEDLVAADGRCVAAAPAQAQAEAPPAPAPAAPADRPVGSMAGDLAGAPMPAGTVASVGPGGPEPGAPTVTGGVALGMTECQAVRRAGTPGNVAISAGDKGERKVVLTYLSGPWPGIYNFSGGRLKEIVRAPAPPEPPKPAKKIKKPVKKPKTAQQ